MVRETDAVAEFRHALTRIMDRMDKHEDRLNSDANIVREHILKCEASGQSAARDLSDIRGEMKSLQANMTMAAKIIIPLIAFVLAVQILGVERAWNLTDSIKVIRQSIPLNP